MLVISVKNSEIDNRLRFLNWETRKYTNLLKASKIPVKDKEKALQAVNIMQSQAPENINLRLAEITGTGIKYIN